MQTQQYRHYKLFFSTLGLGLALTACKKQDEESVTQQTGEARPAPADEAKAEMDHSKADPSGVPAANEDNSAAGATAAAMPKDQDPSALDPSKEAPAVPDISTGFTELFNGKDLTGWTQVLDSKWTVEDGVLVGRQNPEGRREGESWLITDKDYSDFILHLQFRVSPGGNSGVFLRDPLSRADRQAAEDGGKGPWEAGYEVNINNDEPVYPTGSVWDAAKGAPKLQAESEWNDLVVKLQGQHITTWVNGKVAVNNAELPERSTKGGIGFQRHGTPQFKDKLIEFKDISIKEL